VWVLEQLFSGERGTSLAAAKAKNVTIQAIPAVTSAAPARSGPDGVWGSMLAVAEKEWRYLIREPQYKALGMNIVYIMVAWALAFSHNSRGTNAFQALSSMETNGFAQFFKMIIPISISGLLLLSTMKLTFNIFGGEGAAITMLFSFPIPRRYIVMGKNVAYGGVVLIIEIIAVCAVSILTKTLILLPVYICWGIMATLIVLAAGNLISVSFPTKFVMRAGRFSRGGQVSLGASQSPGAGCSYALLYLACALAAIVAEFPAAAAVIVPGVGWISPLWYALTLPMGFIYAVGLYYLSLKIIDSWMVTREQMIITKLVPTE
jgi:hypothetical protein